MKLDANHESLIVIPNSVWEDSGRSWTIAKPAPAVRRSPVTFMALAEKLHLKTSIEISDG